MDTEADPIPTPFTEPITMTELMDSRAVNLLSKNQQIVVMYSGGVDSTAVLISFMKNLPENEWDRLKIYYDEESIQENPEFWRIIEPTKIQKILLTATEYDETMREDDYDLITSGWCADQLFGSDIHVVVPDAYHMPWIDGVKEAYKVKLNLPISDKSLEVIESVYSDYAKTFGVTLNQFCEFAWLFNWAVKWGHVANITNLQLAGSKNSGKGMAFFNTLDFQRWSLGRVDRLHKSHVYRNTILYKRPLKQYIYEYNHINSYYMKKGKLNSMIRAQKAASTLTVLTDQGYKIYSFKDCGTCRAKLIERTLNVFRKIPIQY